MGSVRRWRGHGDRLDPRADEQNWHQRHNHSRAVPSLLLSGHAGQNAVRAGLHEPAVSRLQSAGDPHQYGAEAGLCQQHEQQTDFAQLLRAPQAHQLVRGAQLHPGSCLSSAASDGSDRAH